MSRTENFNQMADTFQELAEMCMKQRDTVAWWTEFGEKWQSVAHLVMDTPPKKESHMQAAQRVMKASADVRDEARKATSEE